MYTSDWVSGYYLLAAVQATPDQAPAAPSADGAAAPVQTPSPVTEEIPARNQNPVAAHAEVPLIQPLYTEDYFRHQGVAVAAHEEPEVTTEDPKTLMVVMSFAEWLNHYKIKSEREEEEARDKSALRSMWQQEKLAAALEDEPEEIPEDVFEMAVTSITREDDLASESLAEILEKQGKWTAAAEMYRKLGLRNPAKSAYFASRAEAAKKRATT
jgi:hypothetical protein